MKRQTRNVLLLTVISAAVLCIMIAHDGAKTLLDALASVRPIWLLAVAGMMAVYWLLESQILHLVVRKFHHRQTFLATLQTSMIGQFFNCITPFASGGQPVQAYHLMRCGVPLGSASCALMVKFIVYQSVLTLYSLVALVLRFGMFRTQVTSLGLLVLVGFGVNAAVIAGLLSLCFFPHWTERFLHGCIGVLARLRLVKDPEASRAKVQTELAGFYEGFAAMRSHMGLIVQMSLLTVIQLTAFFLIPWALYRSFGLAGAPAFSILAVASFVLNLTSFVPLPGAAGGAELGFHLLFAMFFPAKLLAASIILWRAATFYLPICMGLLVTATSAVGNGDKPTDKSCKLPAA
ncbi:MAG: lysylphosphatidylglycerol synthase transmembrane domain-containing protein [Angelakisella sp.]